jgi:hypothetical protein
MGRKGVWGGREHGALGTSRHTILHLHPQATTFLSPPGGIYLIEFRASTLLFFLKKKGVFRILCSFGMNSEARCQGHLLWYSHLDWSRGYASLGFVCPSHTRAGLNTQPYPPDANKLPPVFVFVFVVLFVVFVVLVVVFVVLVFVFVVFVVLVFVFVVLVFVFVILIYYKHYIILFIYHINNKLRLLILI